MFIHSAEKYYPIVYIECSSDDKMVSLVYKIHRRTGIPCKKPLVNNLQWLLSNIGVDTLQCVLSTSACIYKCVND